MERHVAPSLADLATQHQTKDPTRLIAQVDSATLYKAVTTELVEADANKRQVSGPRHAAVVSRLDVAQTTAVRTHHQLLAGYGELADQTAVALAADVRAGKTPPADRLGRQMYYLGQIKDLEGRPPESNPIVHAAVEEVRGAQASRQAARAALGASKAELAKDIYETRYRLARPSFWRRTLAGLGLGAAVGMGIAAAASGDTPERREYSETSILRDEVFSAATLGSGAILGAIGGAGTGMTMSMMRRGRDAQRRAQRQLRKS